MSDITPEAREKSKPVVLFEIAKSMITGDRPDVGEVQKLAMDSARAP